MAEGQFARLREYSDDVVRQPDFDTIRRRAGQVRKHRRHRASTVVAGLTAVVVAAFALSVGPDGGQRSADPDPATSASWDPNAGWPRWIAVEAAAADELYAVTQRCRTCEPLLFVSADAGRTWERRVVPPLPDGGVYTSRLVELRALAPGVVLWTEGMRVSPADLLGGSSPTTSATGTAGDESDKPTPPGADRPAEREWITIDGGRTWQHPVVDPQSVTAAPAGTRLVDCGVVKQEKPCRLYAVDPGTGHFAALAAQPQITYQPGWLGFQVDAPLGGPLWAPGLDPATRKPAVASSPDRGHTWQTHVFTDGVAAEVAVRSGYESIATMYLPAVAAGAGGTAYAQLYRSDNEQTPYRTTDGGLTWLPVEGGPLAETPDAGYLTSDGEHVVKTDDEFLASRNGAPYRPVTLAGYPLELRRLTQVTSSEAAGRFVVTSGDDLYISDDGWTWRPVAMPKK